MYFPPEPCSTNNPNGRERCAKLSYIFSATYLDKCVQCALNCLDVFLIITLTRLSTCIEYYVLACVKRVIFHYTIFSIFLQHRKSRSADVLLRSVSCTQTKPTMMMMIDVNDGIGGLKRDFQNIVQCNVIFLYKYWEGSYATLNNT